MARTPLDRAAQLACSDVVHKRFEALPGTATVDDVRRWFGGRLVGVLAVTEDLAGFCS
jgi:hypothetical protein